MQEVTLVLRVVLGVLFLTSGAAKLRTPLTLTQAIQQYGMGLVGSKPARIVARLLPLSELILGLMIFTGIWLTIAALAATGLLLAFTVPMAINLARGNQFSCHCFGATSSDIGIGSLSRNVILIFASILLSAVSPWSAPGIALLHADVQALSNMDTVALFAAGVGLYVILLLVGEVDILFRSTKAK
jgi:uncharacterized membrane protein YphA (DoxX/SURF4 family)